MSLLTSTSTQQTNLYNRVEFTYKEHFNFKSCCYSQTTFPVNNNNNSIVRLSHNVLKTYLTFLWRRDRPYDTPRTYCFPECFPRRIQIDFPGCFTWSTTSLCIIHSGQSIFRKRNWIKFERVYALDMMPHLFSRYRVEDVDRFCY